jgi:hypothetical protein
VRFTALDKPSKSYLLAKAYNLNIGKELDIPGMK